MRLAVIETTPYGGLLHYAVSFADALAGRGHEVEVIAPRENELASHQGAARMRAVLTPTVDWTKPPPARGQKLRILARRALVASRLARSWARILVEARRGRYDMVVVNSDVGLSVTATGALLLTRLPGGPPVVQVAHNVRAFNRWGGSELFASSTFMRAVYPRMVRGFDLVLVHGEKNEEEFRSRWPASSVFSIPHGGDTRIFGQEPPPPSEEERVLFFGDWRKIKGLPVLLEAFDQLAERRPLARLTIAGRPAPQDMDPELVHRWAARHGDRVEVIDRYVPIEDVRKVFGAARVVVTPYVAGFQSGVLHLAMNNARAVVVSDVGELGPVVRAAGNGLVVPPDSAGALADALEEVLADPGRAAELGAAGRRHVLEASGWDRVAELVEGALSSLNGSNPSRAPA
jgi:glycosyltransferase involved in cell wall biosynthesis